ncbi:Alpha/Beta hydrolase protein [Calycina marina]|uniref:Carboxylic ester hydrolase n=1 Tax=Calycina marina TaxID=1763456 RepID=A0A9P7Z3N0_9HELO|nr:Alpha/Beta hydrolase protein [Calycina marina]
MLTLSAYIHAMKMRVNDISKLLVAALVFGTGTLSKTVRTGSGPVKGHYTSAKHNVLAYLGIPYAQAPIGNLRFMPPVRYHGTTRLNGSNIGHACAAITPFAAGGNKLENYNLKLANLTAAGVAIIADQEQLVGTFSEDCLTVNVWAPAHDHGRSKKKAVMVYIYGGGFTSGSTQIAGYDGQHLASDWDVIVVTLNYRLNVLGFPGAPGLENKNPGFLDQRMAVEWVRDNIAGFGGDTSKITLFGQSAGSASVDSYTYSWAKDPIVSGFIMESGVAGFGDALPADNAAEWYKASEALGCGTKDNASDAVILSCIQNKPVGDVFKAIGDFKYNPTVDGITGFADYPALSRAGKFAQLPVLVGNNDYEVGIYIPVYALYGVTNDEAYYEDYQNRTFACPAGARANVSASHTLPVWRYRWFGEFPNTRLMTTPNSGAYHCSEIAFVWNTLPRGEGIPPDTPAEISIRKYVQGAWTTFAKDPQHGLDNYGWPRYTPYESTLIRLAYNNKTGTNKVTPALYDSTCKWTFPISKSGDSTHSTPEPEMPDFC